MTRLAKALFGQVGDQGGQVRDQVGQGQGQELDNYSEEISNSSPVSLAIPIENEVNGNSLIMCSLCNTTLRRSRFNHHIKVKHGSTGNSQTVNDKTFSSSKVKVKCELCGRQMLKSSIKKHEREYHIKKNTCQTCGRVFMFKSSLIAHECCVQEDIETDK